MQVFHHPNPNKPQTSSRILNFILVFGFICTIYLLVAFDLVPTTNHIHKFYLQSFNSSSSSSSLSSPSSSSSSSLTCLEHIVFGIASNENSWLRRKEYVRSWWMPHIMRGCVFLEKMPQNVTIYHDDTISLPPICISDNTSDFRYTYRGGLRSAIRVARVVVETVALNHSNVRWYVFGDDDTIFFPENLAKTLSKYDHGLWYYVGTNSESVMQNKFFSYDMAFGGAGFAISSPLANVLAKVFDSCIQKYPHLYGSDGRIHACLTELGVSLTLEPGFHQMDIRGNVFGLLAAHTIKPLVSLHHLDVTDPIFPKMTREMALSHLLEAAKFDSQRILQQTVCYDRWFSWTISVSWGYVVQVIGHHVFLRDALRKQESYMPWKKSGLSFFYEHDTAEFHSDPCRRPVVFFFDSASSSSSSSSSPAPGRGKITSIYKMMTSENCTYDMASPRKLKEIRVFSQKLELDTKQLLAPRRHCCDVLNSSDSGVMEVNIRECGNEEMIRMHDP